MTQARMVGWAVGPDGYVVQVLDGENQPVAAGRFGNNPLSSGAGDTLPLDHPMALGQETLEIYARRTAADMAEEHGLPENGIFRDEDLETALQEQYDEHVALDGLAP
ncbi:hypothetical protein [Rhizobium leguminosarum]|uniref:hypothetical protein n=1 Tax=Rhizobium leguminosarum TaxID=384 RepID=UPI002E145533|nr:hypothetical protein U8Q02_38400 [Rhizobium leguminosarum]